MQTQNIMAINSIRATEDNMIVPFNEHPHKMKKGGKVKGYADGSTVLPTDPIKKSVPVNIPASSYDPNVFTTELAKYPNKYDAKGKLIKQGIPLDANGQVLLPVGALRTQVPALTNSVKSTQDYLYNYMNANKKRQLTASEADAQLKAAKMGSYENYINQAKNLQAYRNLTVTPSKSLNTTDELQTLSFDSMGGSNAGGGLQLNSTIPFDSTHIQQIFPKNTYTPQHKASGGKVYSNGIKGYVEGGDLQEASTRDTTSRKYKNGILANAEDMALFAVDNPLSTVGLGNVIKSNNYQTKLGAQTGNQLNNGVQKIGPGIAGAVLNYYIPGSGTALKAGVGALSNTQGEDTGLNATQSATQSKIGGAVDTIGNLTSMLGSRGKQKNDDNGTATANPVSDSAVTDVANAASKVYSSTQKPAQVTDGSQLTGQALSDFKSAQTGEAQAQVLQKYNTGGYNGMAKGGKVVGAGTGKSDSIKAKPEEGSFIVPAENAKLAQEIREKYLGKPKDQVATLKKGGGVDVMLSNGEHMFTKDEANLLRAKGIDLDALAPNADSASSGKADGGGIDDIIAEINKQEAKSKSDEALRKKQYADRLKNEQDANKRAELERQEKETANTAAQRKQVLDYKKNELLKVYSAYQKAPETSTRSSVRPKQQYLQDLKDAVKNYQGEYKKQYPETSSVEKNSTDNSSNSVMDKMNQQVADEKKKINDIQKNRTPNQTAIAAGVKNNPSVGNKVNGVGISGVGKPVAQKKELSMAESKKLNSGIESLPIRQADVEQLPVNNSAPDQMTAVSVPASIKNPVQKPSPFDKIDFGKGLALAQTGLGIEQLLKDGKRPVDSLDPEFVQSVNDAKAESNYGISPLERSIADRGIDRNRAADVQNIINLSGGSAGTALGNIRAASMAADEAKGNLSAQSEALRLQKKRYADNLIAQKAGMSKQLFNEKLGAFQQNQDAGSMLLGAGIKNLIGNQRYRTELAADAETNKLSNPTFNIQ